MPIALYIHIPFCMKKCAYCDFTSYADRQGELSLYLKRLENEITQFSSAWPDPKPEIASVFIGGGTPSLLSGDQLQWLMECVRTRFELLSNAEITIEANPGTLDEPKLRSYHKAGINRLSVGAQAMQPALLTMLGRIHSWEQVIRSVHMARTQGFDNINLDLMYALPGQTPGDWQRTLDAALALEPEHISAYNLILEHATPLWEQVQKGELAMLDEQTALDMQRAATVMLARAGLARYEISNYARPGFECRHNITYWTRGEYLGLGTAAHSLMGERRFSNSAELDYHMEEETELNAQDAEEERIMLGTRMMNGIEPGAICPHKIERVLRLGLAELRDGRICPTEKGMELHNQLVLALI